MQGCVKDGVEPEGGPWTEAGGNWLREVLEEKRVGCSDLPGIPLRFSTSPLLDLFYAQHKSSGCRK